MKLSKSILFLMFSLLLASGQMYGQDTKGMYNTDDSKIALQGYSPVSYVELNLAQRGSKAYKSEYKGLNYYFTDADQKKEFDRNPGKYLPEYGGWCATGIAVGQKFRTDPNKFLVSNGKLYLFLYDVEVDAKQLWLADEKKMMAKAEKNWKKMH